MKRSRSARATSAIVSANKLALNLVHFIESGGIGPQFLMDALQEYENTRAVYCDQENGYQYSGRFRMQLDEASKALRNARNDSKDIEFLYSKNYK